MSEDKSKEENNPTEIVIGDNASEISNSRGKERFKALTKKVINVQRLLPVNQIFSVGQDPGIDPKTVDYDIHRQCEIFCIDFCENHVSSEDLTNKSLREFLEKGRPSESKVRWINVDGVSWDVIKTLSIHYDIHPLAIEDSLQENQRTKLDQYQNHLYISLLLHTLIDSDDKKNDRNDLLHLNHRDDIRYLETHRILRKEKLHIRVEQVSIFLIEKDVLITIFRETGNFVYTPIITRIGLPKTLLRTSQDASLLMEAVIDAIVDLAIPIKDSYRHQIAELEGKLLIRPKMDYTRELHMISGELTILKRTLGPIQGLITLLREHSDEKNLISPLAKTYFMDVLDHCAEIVDDLDTMTKITENLVNMVFNLITYETNENMRVIAIFSVVFLPMTFFAGYYGMNFEDFPVLKKEHAIYDTFWLTTGVGTTLMVIVGTYSIWTKWVARFYRYLNRQREHGRKIKNTNRSVDNDAKKS